MKKKTKNKIIVSAIVVFLAGLFWFFGNDLNKYPLNGEISKCMSEDVVVFQYLDEKLDTFPEYYNEGGEKITCDIIGGETSEKCGKFLDSLSECQVVYRFFENDKKSRIFSQDAESALPIILKAKNINY